MRHVQTPLIALVTLALSACSTVAPPATTHSPTGAQPPSSNKMGVVEIEFSGIGSQLRASVVPQLGSQSLASASCVTMGPVGTQSIADVAGKHYLQATFPLTNNCGRDLNNLTYVATRRIDATPTLGGSAVSRMTTATGSAANPNLATQILPTQPVYVRGLQLRVDQERANLQVFDDFAGSELDSLQTQVDSAHTTYDLLPYGFVATTSTGARLIPTGASAEVTFAVALPIQPTPAQDVYSFRLLMSPGTNNVTAITQGLEEQDAAERDAVTTRAAGFPLTEIRTLLGPNLTPANVARGGRVVCQVRTAGPRNAPTATLVNAAGTVSLSSITRPLVLGSAQNQPITVVTVAGQNFLSRATFFNLSPTKLSVISNYLRPVGLYPLAPQTGTVQVNACNQTRTVNIKTSPFNSLYSSSDSFSAIAISKNGSAIVWGRNANQADVPVAVQSGVVGVAGDENNYLALKTDGGVHSWKSGSGGTESNLPASVQSGVIAVGYARYQNAFALKSNGSVVNWNVNSTILNSVPEGAQSGVVALALGSLHALALKADGSVVAWGDNTWGETTVPEAALSGVIGVAAGGLFSLALKSDGGVIGWGINFEGQTNIPVAARSNVIAIAAGYDIGMALKNTGSVVAWGSNAANQTTIPASAQSGVVAIAANQHTSYALKSDGTIVAWGDNYYKEATIPVVTGGYQVP